MNNTDNNFEEVRRLMKLKSHEVPPPGFFDKFSDNVISRIQDGKRKNAESIEERFERVAPWLLNFIRLFETRPGVVGAAATALCLMLVVGVVVFERTDNPGRTMIAGTEVVESGSPMATVSSPLLLAGEPSGGIMVSTNTANLQPLNIIFGSQAGQPVFQQVNFNKPNP